MTRTLAIALEAVGSCTVLAGIIVEIITGAEVGYLVITSGAFLTAIGGLIFAKLWRQKR